MGGLEVGCFPVFPPPFPSCSPFSRQVSEVRAVGAIAARGSHFAVPSAHSTARGSRALCSSRPPVPPSTGKLGLGRLPGSQFELFASQRRCISPGFGPDQQDPEQDVEVSRLRVKEKRVWKDVLALGLASELEQR